MFKDMPRGIRLGPNHIISNPVGPKPIVSSIINRIIVLNSSVPEDEKNVLSQIFFGLRSTNQYTHTLNYIDYVGWSDVYGMFDAIQDQTSLSKQVIKADELRPNPMFPGLNTIRINDKLTYIYDRHMFTGIPFLESVVISSVGTIACLEYFGKLDEFINTCETYILTNY